MADQTIKIQNDSGSHERVAYDIWRHLMATTDDAKSLTTSDQRLDLYVQCRIATFGTLSKDRK